jgi:hypothetical protein
MSCLAAYVISLPCIRRTGLVSPVLPGIGYVEAGAVEYDGDRAENPTGNIVACRAISYGLIVETLLKLEFPITIQTPVLISGHQCPPLF